MRNAFHLLILASSLHCIAAAGNVLFVYHSETNHTAQLAEALAAGRATVPSATCKVQTIEATDVQRDVVEWADALVIGSPVHYGNPASAMIQWFETEWEALWAAKEPPVKFGAVFATGGGLAQGVEHVLAGLQRLLWSYRARVLTPNPTRSGYSSYGAVAITGTPPYNGSSAIAQPFVDAAKRFGVIIANEVVADVISYRNKEPATRYQLNYSG